MFIVTSVSAYSVGELSEDVKNFFSSFGERFTGHSTSSDSIKTIGVSEFETASLSCDEGQVIRSAEALYWCPDGSGRSVICNTDSAIGKSSFSFTFRNVNCGGDPCIYVRKKGNLTISCGDVLCNNYRSEGECYVDSSCVWVQGPTYAMVCQDKVDEEGNETSDDGESVYTCTDSDGGKNYYVKGVAESNAPAPYYYSMVIDYCANTELLQEVFCGFDGIINISGYECPNGCLEGVCNGDLSSNNSNVGVCSSDFNEDGVVDYGDYDLLVSAYRSNIQYEGTEKYDLNNDGLVGEDDYFIFADNYGKVCVENADSSEDFEEKVIPVSNEMNKKNMEAYLDKEAFLVSDTDWKEVLPLVPVTTWTQQEGDDSECQRGYGTPESVCVYPTLIWHEDENNDLYIDLDSWRYEGNAIAMMVFYPKGGELTFFDEKDANKSHNLLPGENIIFYYHIETDDVIEKIQIDYLPDFLEFVNPSDGIIENIDSSFPNGHTFEFILKVKDDANSSFKTSFDADSIIYFMQQYSPSELKVVGETPQELDNLLIVEPELGAGLNESQISRISSENYLSYWESYKDVVYVENDYGMALMASTYASLLNAPLIIEGTDLDNDVNFENRNVICVGDVNWDCNENYDLEQLQKKYLEETDTKKFILTSNNLDYSITEKFLPKKSNEAIFNLYSKNSLGSPFIAGAKQQLILIADNSNFEDINDNLNNFYSENMPFYESSCLGGDNCSFGFTSKNVKFYGVENKFESSINLNHAQFIQNPSDYIILFKGALIDCPAGKNTQKITLYINGEEVAVKEFYCSTPENAFATLGWSSLAFEGIVLPYDNGLINLALEYEGKLLFIDRYPLIKIYFDQDGSLFNIGECNSMEDPCASQLKPYNLKITYFNSDAYFNFSNLNTNERYRLILNNDYYPMGFESFNLYVNDFLLEGKDGVIYQMNYGFDIPILNSSDISIRLEPTDIYSSEINYKTNVILTSDLSDYSLTIIETPSNIPFREYLPVSGTSKTLDPEYADVNRDHLPDLAVGRIMGITSSDVSSYIARSLFYNQLEKTNKATFMSSSYQNYIDLGEKWSEEFENSDYNVVTDLKDEEQYSFNPDLWKNNFLISYADHGSNRWAGINSEDIPLLSNSLIFNNACSTCSQETANQFCAVAIRNGALGHLGAISITFGRNNIHMNVMNGIYYKNFTLGQAFSKGFVYDSSKFQTTLIGDPTLHLNPPRLLNHELKYKP